MIASGWILREAGFHGGSVPNVHLAELVIGGILDIHQIFQIARVGQGVQIDNARIRVVAHKAAHHMRSNEAGPAGDEDGSHFKNRVE